MASMRLGEWESKLPGLAAHALCIARSEMGIILFT